MCSSGKLERVRQIWGEDRETLFLGGVRPAGILPDADEGQWPSFAPAVSFAAGVLVAEC